MRGEGEDDEGEEDAADAAGGAGNAGGESAAGAEPVADGGEAGVEEEGGGDAAEDAEGEEEVPEFLLRVSRWIGSGKGDVSVIEEKRENIPVEKLKSINAATRPSDPVTTSTLTPYASNTGPTCAPPKYKKKA